MSLDYDLIGDDPDYAIQDYRFMIFKDNQVVPLEAIAHVHTIEVRLITGVDSILLEENVDWQITADNQSTRGMSVALQASPTFSGNLAESISMIRSVSGGNYIISVSFQKLEKNFIPHDLDLIPDLEFTPDLLKEMLRDIQAIKSTHTNMRNVTAQTLAAMTNKPIDLTGVDPDNAITEEEHTLDVPNNVQIIRPVQGAFYATPLVVTVVATGLPLEADTDYVVGSFDTGRTKATSSSVGVYNCIVVKTAVVGAVTIDYQAFGGEVTAFDVNMIRNALLDVTGYLTNTDFITNDSLGGTAIIQQLLRRLESQEEEMRRLAAGSPSYGDKTNGMCFVHKFETSDTDRHFYNIASLRTVDGSSEVITADRAHYRIQGLHTGKMFDVIISANIDDPDNPFTLEVISDLSIEGYKQHVHYNDLDNRVLPQFRLIWNDVTGIRSGAYLQIGLALNNIIVETMAIEDLSGSESCWIMTPEQPVAFLPQDDIITLPDGSSVWSDAVETSQEVIKTLPARKGYLVWAGSIPLTSCAVQQTLQTIGDGKNVTIADISRVEFDIFDRRTGSHIKSISHVTAGKESISESVMFYPEDLCSLNYEIALDINFDAGLKVTSILQQNSTVNNRFDLNHITVFFD